MSSVFKSSFVYIFIGFLPVAANLLLAPVYTLYMKPEEYALVGIGTLVQTFLTFFLTLSLDGAFARLFFDYERKKKLKHALLSSLVIAIVALSALVLAILLLYGDAIFGFLISNNEFRFSNYGIWIYLTTFSNAIFILFALLYRNEGDLRKFVIVNIAFFFVPVAGTLTGLIIFDGGALGAIIGRAVGSLVLISLILAAYFSKAGIIFRKKQLRLALKYSLPLVPYQLMFAGFSNIDRIILERSFTDHDFGVYNFAIMVCGVIPIFMNALTNATSPQIYRELSTTKNHSLVKRYNDGIVLLTVGLICAFAAVVVPVLRLFISAEYSDCYIYIVTVILSFIPYVHFLTVSTPLFFHGKTKTFPVISFLALAAGIAFNIFLTPVMGIWAVVFSLYVIRGVQMLSAYFFVFLSRYHTLEYVRQRKALIVSAIIIVVYNLLLLLVFRNNNILIDFVNLAPLVSFLIIGSLAYKDEIRMLLSGSYLKPAAAGEK